jgi:hypothetical protein
MIVVMLTVFKFNGEHKSCLICENELQVKAIYQAVLLEYGYINSNVHYDMTLTQDFGIYPGNPVVTIEAWL